MNITYIGLVLFVCNYADSYRFQKTLGHIKPKVNSNIQAIAVSELIQRILPSDDSKFIVTIDPNFIINEKEAFRVFKDVNGSINLIGTSGVAAATAFNHYLKYFCNAHISWEATQLNLPPTLPDVDITISFNDRFRYYQNVCTTSYSFVWWSWEDWEKHIDWIVLNSYNFVLAFNGQEAIWERVYHNLNFTQGEIDEHFTGPAFLSWLRMGNLRGWGGPLSPAWHQRSIWLQKKILEKLRNFGVITILPAFAGHLPRAIRRIYPDINVTKMVVWNDFNDSYCCPYFLDPTEPLFKVIGKLFMEEQIKEFGTDHVYNCDSFNEVDPASTDLQYLSDVGQSIYGAMTDADPNAIWLMQGWLFYNSKYWQETDRAKALVTSVPTGKLIILDLQSEEFPQFGRLESYYGQPYIWCMLHDFGGTLGMFGSASIVNEKIIEARNEENSTMIGTGLTPEGINQNYVIYDLMSEAAWRQVPSNLTDWFRNYTIRRYGKVNTEIIQAWQILKDTIYDFKGLNLIRGKYAITMTPNTKFNIWTWYNYSDVFEAWDIFVKNVDDLKDNPAFLHDVVDLTRQVLQINGDIYYQKLMDSFKKKDKQKFSGASNTFLSIFDDLELILSTNKAFLLGPWIESAKKCANSSEEENQFEYNARNQITLWGPKGEIINYANKQWSGIVSDYYKPRWDLFLSLMDTSLEDNITFIESAAKRLVFKRAEEPFTFDKTLFPTEPTGNTIEAAKLIHKKWRNIDQINFQENPYNGHVPSQREPLLSFV